MNFQLWQATRAIATLLLVAPSSGQKPLDAAALSKKLLEDVDAAKEAYGKELEAAENRVVGAIEAKIAAVARDVSTSLEARATRKTQLETVLDRFRQGIEVPAKDFPGESKRYHADLAEARRKCRKRVKEIATRVQRISPEHAASIQQDLDRYCPLLVDVRLVEKALAPICDNLENRARPHKSIGPIREAMRALMQGASDGTLTAQKVTERCVSLKEQIESSPVYEDKKKASYGDLHDAVNELDALLRTEK